MDVESLKSQCIWCRSREPQEPGAHHAIDCPLYRSPFVGPEAEYWHQRLREFLNERRRQKANGR
jgi:hypothetical protein